MEFLSVMPDFHCSISGEIGKTNPNCAANASGTYLLLIVFNKNPETKQMFSSDV
jgi:hypothetical protein